MSVHIEDACKQAIESINKFKADWYAGNNKNDSRYPLHLPNDNAGLWFEFIADAITGRDEK